jgi:ethanolamine utilization protein EutQ (cupin superfamily)
MTPERGPVVNDAVQVMAAGEPPKTIIEYVGRVATGDERVSVALMRSPEGWTEPAQTPEFDEYTVVLQGTLVLHHDGGETAVRGGQAVNVPAGMKVRYSTPDGAEYVSICVPAFAFDLAHRDEE